MELFSNFKLCRVAITSLYVTLFICCVIKWKYIFQKNKEQKRTYTAAFKERANYCIILSLFYI